MQGLECWGGGPDGGIAVLMSRARGLVLPGDHGRVGGMVAGVWRPVAVSAWLKLVWMCPVRGLMSFGRAST